MRVFAFAATFVLAVVFVVVGGQSANAQSQEEKDNKPEKVMVTVEKGDTLSKIAKKHDTTYVRIFKANKKIKDPDVIHPGDEYRIPAKDEKLPDRALPGDKPAKPAPQAAAPAPVPQPRRQTVPSVAPNYASGNSVWDRLAACESGGNWSINTGNGYYGGLQFSLSSWRGVGGSGYPHQASREEQIRRGEMLRASGGWGHWPACSAKLGLR